MKRLFESDEHTSLYAKYRYPVSEKIIEPIMKTLEKDLSPPYDLMLDVGCGSGQASIGFAKHFRKYVGVDISEGQIEQAKSSREVPKNAEFRVGPSEELSFLEDNSVDLISASQSYHWFDVPKFCKEARRVMKPGGILAAYAYVKVIMTSEEISAGQNELIEQARLKFYAKLEPYWDPVRMQAVDEYRTTEFPYDEVETFHFSDVLQKDYAFLKGFFMTLSPYQTILKNDPTKAKMIIQELDDEIKCAFGQAWNGDETKVTITRPYCLVTCRKPKTEP